MQVTMLGSSHTTYRNQPATLGDAIKYQYAYAPVQTLSGAIDLQEELEQAGKTALKTSDGKVWDFLENIVDLTGKIVPIVKNVKTGQTGQVQVDPVTGKEVVYVPQTGQTSQVVSSGFDINKSMPWLVGGVVGLAVLVTMIAKK